MRDERGRLENAYLQHLSEADLQLLGAGETRSVVEVLDRSDTFDRIFGGDPLFVASPFLVFAAAVHRTAADLDSATYVEEWLGPRQRIPVLDVADLRDFLAGPWRRLFLVELLASYTHVTSGSGLVATRRGWRRQRFSERDPVRLAGLLYVVTEAERPGIFRRLGDLSLFLTGVFADHTALHGFGSVDQQRLLRAGRLNAPTA